MSPIYDQTHFFFSTYGSESCNFYSFGYPNILFYVILFFKISTDNVKKKGNVFPFLYKKQKSIFHYGNFYIWEREKVWYRVNQLKTFLLAIKRSHFVFLTELFLHGETQGAGAKSCGLVCWWLS